MRARIMVGLAVVAAALLPLAPAHAADGSVCAGSTICVNQLTAFGGAAREYGVSTGGPAGTSQERYRVDVICGLPDLEVRLIGLPLIGASRTITSPIPSPGFCPDLLPLP